MIIACIFAACLSTGLVVLFYQPLNDAYFYLIFVHQALATLALAAVTIALAFFVTRLHTRRLIQIIAWIDVPLLGVMILHLGAAFFFPWLILHMILIIWISLRKSLRSIGVFLSLILFANVTGIAVHGGDQWKIAPFIHGLFGIAPLFSLAWALNTVRTSLGRSLSKERIFPIAAIALAFVCIPSWYKKNFGTYPEQTYGNETGGEKVGEVPRPAPADLLRSSSCGVEGCHNVYYDQWAASTHRFSSNNRLFRRVVGLAVEDSGPEADRSCVNCHDPVATLSNAGLVSWPQREPGADEGVNCKVCHLLRGGDYRTGNGAIVLARETKYPYQDAPIGSRQFDKFKAFVQSDPRQHVRTYRASKSFSEPEYCLPCHLVTVDRKNLNMPPLRLHLLYKQWADSPWKSRFTCQECHMPIFQIGPRYYKPKDHRFLGVSTIHGQLAIRRSQDDYERLQNHAYFTKKYLAGTLFFANEDMVFEPKKGISRLDYPVRDVGLGISLGRGMKRQKKMLEYLGSGPLLSVELEAKVTQKDSSKYIRIKMETSNARVGHEFPSGPLDLVRCWCEITAIDNLGRTVWVHGGVDENGDLLEDAMYLGCRELLDNRGKKIEDHRFWRTDKVVGKQVLPPFAKRVDELDFRIPDGTDGDLTIKATWRYLRITPKIIAMLLDESFPRMEPLDVGSATAMVHVVP